MQLKKNFLKNEHNKELTVHLKNNLGKIVRNKKKEIYCFQDML